MESRRSARRQHMQPLSLHSHVPFLQLAVLVIFSRTCVARSDFAAAVRRLAAAEAKGKA